MAKKATSTSLVAAVTRPTTLIEAPRLGKRLGVELTLASETFQHTGSFKFRAAYSVASQVPHSMIVTASSGNYGQALAYACALIKKRCLVVMPSTSAQVKIDAVREYGAEVDLTDVRVKSRLERLGEVAQERPEAYVSSPYDDLLVVEGNATLGEELAAVEPAFDVVVAPVGGGGLTSGIITGIRGAGKETQVVAAEPLLANDAARSLRAGQLLRNESEPTTIADGARTLSLGKHNWEILCQGLAGIVEVPEEKIVEAVRLLFSLANLKAEPTGALSLGALLTDPTRFAGRRVCCVISGGNVDPEVYRKILAAGN
jgi:threonine dehydratase